MIHIPLLLTAIGTITTKNNKTTEFSSGDHLKPTTLTKSPTAFAQPNETTHNPTQSQRANFSQTKYHG